jgi:hypothetical protein
MSVLYRRNVTSNKKPADTQQRRLKKFRLAVHPGHFYASVSVQCRILIVHMFCERYAHCHAVSYASKRNISEVVAALDVLLEVVALWSTYGATDDIVLSQADEGSFQAADLEARLA